MPPLVPTIARTSFHLRKPRILIIEDAHGLIWGKCGVANHLIFNNSNTSGLYRVLERNLNRAMDREVLLFLPASSVGGWGVCRFLKKYNFLNKYNLTRIFKTLIALIKILQPGH